MSCHPLQLASDIGTPCTYSPSPAIYTTGKLFPAHNPLPTSLYQGWGWGVNNFLAPTQTHPDDSDMTLLLKPGEGIHNPRKSDASIRLIHHTHDSNIHLQFLCTPRSAGRSIQRLIKGLPPDTTPFAPKHEGDLLNICGGDGRKDVYFSFPQTRRI